MQGRGFAGESEDKPGSVMQNTIERVTGCKRDVGGGIELGRLRIEGSDVQKFWR
jgi:hypothetical protein